MKFFVTVTAGLAMLVSASAQTIVFNLDALAAKAKQKAEITLEGPLLAQALQTVPDKIKGAVANVTRLMVRHYEFDKPAQYSDADLEAVRKPVSSWPRVLNVKDERESVEIYMSTGPDGRPSGFLLIAAEPKELTVVQVVGSIDLANLKEVVNSTIHYDLKTVAGQ
jgi:Domain of unknown function (DUF4252)